MPQVGDILRAESEACAYVRSIKKQQAGTRFICQTRRTEIAGACERFDHEQPTFDETSEGPVLIGWKAVRLAASGHVVPVPGVPASQILRTTDDVQPLAGDRIRMARGGIYRVVRVRSLGTLGDLTVVELIEESAYGEMNQS